MAPFLRLTGAKRAVFKANVENCRNDNRSTLKNSLPNVINIRFCGKLSQIFFEQLRSGTVLLYLGMQLVYVVGHGKQQDFG